MVESAAESSQKASNLAIRQRLSEISAAVSWVYIAKKYFNKTDSNDGIEKRIHAGRTKRIHATGFP
jgi:hypothetical protein